jgi:large subunit ribosomal protein L19
LSGSFPAPEHAGPPGNEGIKENIIMDRIRAIEREHMRYDVPAFKAGDTVRVHVRIIEGEKERTQVFQGTVLRLNRGRTDATFVVRKISDGVGVERVFPLHSPAIDRIEVVSEGKVRQGRIYYLRKLKGKAARIKSKNSWN